MDLPPEVLFLISYHKGAVVICFIEVLGSSTDIVGNFKGDVLLVGVGELFGVLSGYIVQTFTDFNMSRFHGWGT
jgi:hypothetical protein